MPRCAHEIDFGPYYVFTLKRQSLLSRSRLKGQLLHAVSFKFKDTASKEQIKQV